MSEFVTVARPYAKAAFDFAVEHNSVERWQDMLAFVAEVTKNEQMTELLSGALAPETLSDVFIAVCGEQLDENGQNLIRVMAENGRLNALPDVLEQFIHLRAASEATAEVEVISAAQMSDEQLAKITAAMEKRLSRKVKLNCKIDKSVMAGVIIRSGDMVIDGSVRGRLERLASCWINREDGMFASEEGKKLMKDWNLPEGLMGVGALALGYASSHPHTVKPRKEDYYRIIK